MEQSKQSEELLFLLKSLGNQMTQCFERKTDISLTRYEILQILAKKERVLQGELQKVLKIDQGAVTRHLKILEEKHYVTRERNPQNNREVYVQISPAGQAIIQGCQTNKKAVLEQFYQGINDAQKAELITVLGMISQNITTMD